MSNTHSMIEGRCDGDFGQFDQVLNFHCHVRLRKMLMRLRTSVTVSSVIARFVPEDGQTRSTP